MYIGMDTYVENRDIEKHSKYLSLELSQHVSLCWSLYSHNHCHLKASFSMIIRRKEGRISQFSKHTCLKKVRKRLTLWVLSWVQQGPYKNSTEIQISLLYDDTAGKHNPRMVYDTMSKTVAIKIKHRKGKETFLTIRYRLLKSICTP